MLTDVHHNVAMTRLPTMPPEELRAIREELGLKQYEAPPLSALL
jgi:DNA-binding transcriptional regulator YiaG